MKSNEIRFKAILETKGRKTGESHRVELLVVRYNGKVYFSRRNASSDWLKNAIANPQVRVEFDGKKISGTARLVDNKILTRKISSLKYTEKKRQEEHRIVLEISLLTE